MGKQWGRFGPPWYRPADAIKAANVLQIRNRITVSDGIGAVSTAPAELTACRNFVAHRGESTAKHRDLLALRLRLNAPPRYRPDALATAYVRGGVTLFEEWCIELSNLAAAATT
jgi:hypothetical protein